jgi:hypothetical protein
MDLIQKVTGRQEFGRGFVVSFQPSAVNISNKGVLYLKEQYSFTQNGLQALTTVIST